jgi:RNA polymerase sigma-70 factor, ECF subfamily
LKPTDTQIDPILLGRILQKEQAAFTELVAKFQRRIFTLTLRMTGNQADAEDLTQEIFLRIYQNLAAYDATQPLAPWIYRLACNHTLNFLKRRRVKLVSLTPPRPEESGLADQLVAHDPDPEVATIAASQYRQLQLAMQQLPENYRLVFTLKYTEDLTATEISEILQAPRNTIKTWLLRAREMLREILNQQGVSINGQL